MVNKHDTYNHAHPGQMRVNVGSDILSLARLERVFERFGEAFVRRILSPGEREAYAVLTSEARRMQFLGGRFCGKEAVFKALAGVTLVRPTWQRVSILAPRGSAKPLVHVDGRVCENVSLSISHEEAYVVAVACSME